VQVTGGDKSELTAILQRVEREMGLVETPEDHAERGHYYRSTTSAWPSAACRCSRWAGAPTCRGGKAAGDAASEDYTNNRYHQPSDEYSDSWDFSGMAQEVELYYRLGRALADSTVWPNWHPGDEFRAIRDQPGRSGREDEVTGQDGR
jgi:hypothetical protein